MALQPWPMQSEFVSVLPHTVVSGAADTIVEFVTVISTGGNAVEEEIQVSFEYIVDSPW